jgi:hypothetical protein
MYIVTIEEVLLSNGFIRDPGVPQHNGQRVG